ncbi:MAG: TlpA family protein disulfide reductase [Desulfobacterales bacterium]|nr:MAG: TlpA family protein disulfide reductase [Desulfobacterales bacterium]
MKKLSTIRAALFSAFFILLGLALMHVFYDAPAAGSESPDLEQLFREMRIDKVPQAKLPVEFSLNDQDGRPVSLSDFRGKIVFLNFWTTWCPTCRIEMPSMEKLHQKFKDRNFAMVTIDLQESASRVKEFFKEYKLTFTALLDTSGNVGMMFGINQIPTTYILDKKGRIIGKALGPREWDSRKSIALFEHLTNRQPPASTADTQN